MGRWSALIILGAVVATASADPEEVHGFVASGTGELKGTVTDAKGAPLVNATVHVVPATGPKRLVSTDRHGRYRVVLRGGDTHVYVLGAGRIAGSVGREANSVITIDDITPPAIAAKPVSRRDTIPPYSDAAIEANVWARAWLMLHVDPRGAVTHVKLLNAPGYDLDRTAVQHAFELRFEPARDRAKRPTPSLVVWTYEWPAYWWMRNGGFPLMHLPSAVAREGCPRPRRRVYERDCSDPNLAEMGERPWIPRPNR